MLRRWLRRWLSRRAEAANARRYAEFVLAEMPLAERFRRMHEAGWWGPHESRSGQGSTLHQTERLRAELPGLLGTLGVTRLLDIPCGDFFWMQRVALGRIEYTGADIVDSLIAELAARYTAPGRSFVVADLTVGPLPSADAILCRDCLVHLSDANIARAFDVIRTSGARYLLTTTYTAHDENRDVPDGDWRPINFVRPPYSLPAPIMSLVEGSTEYGDAHADKTLAVWRVDEL